MANENSPFIFCENLMKIYHIGDSEVLALQGLDLTIQHGELMAIVGPSGSGKSTLMNILGGLDRPTAGIACVNGMNLLKLSKNELDIYRKRQVGFVWQQTARNLVPYLTAWENVELLLLLSGNVGKEDREWGKELLMTVGLGERFNHRLEHLSGGEQQRVAIAASLVNRPSLLLADEPTGEVDSSTANQILDIFRSLNDKYEVTMIIVTHDINVSEHVDRTVSIRDGKTSTERIRHAPPLTVGAVKENDEDTERNRETESEEEINYREYVVLDSAGRLQIPPDYREELKIFDRVELDKVEEGILIRPVEGREGASEKKQISEEHDEETTAHVLGKKKRAKLIKGLVQGVKKLRKKRDE